MQKKFFITIAVLLFVSFGFITAQNTIALSKKEDPDTKVVRAEVDEVIDKKMVKLTDTNGDHYTALNHDYKKLDVLLVEVSDNGAVLKQEKRNSETVKITDRSQDGRWLVGRNERGELYAVDKKSAKLGDKLHLEVNMFGDIYSLKKEN
ncbi:hypothetical protein MF621_004024 (plasmid) [Bacillus velezensis]|uniref:hypothetical protein n=1 Tax=Bacillus velezensis TaxID=492670 RepID=UPI0004A0B5B3|nr:hypothetical protein [Bacillus velezensis]KDN88931.1 hypothetical protein EF87_21735 [Bacillus amyloliquefaciens]URJ76318.1 hypothetical protein MF619_004062 [Bacillus velezensis]URJ80438.1 hypothetical protein MF621_004024 [Bacillus velezensis]